ncbi:MAG: hypothetical protein ACRDRT_01755 [Pseudonocardiaceae bacterium]
MRSPSEFTILGAVSLVVHLPEDLAARVEASATKRGVSAEEVVAEAVAAHLPAGDEQDPLDRFIGSGDSGDATWATRDIRQLRHELAARQDP